MTAAPLVLLLLAAGARSDSPALTERQKAEHVLNRLAFGPRPGDVDTVVEMGVDRWIARQLMPASIKDDAVEAKLSKLETLDMTAIDLFERYEKPRVEMQRSLQKELGDLSEEEVEARRREMRRSMSPENESRKPIRELIAAKLIRSVESERQLDEVMTDFWMNHFNVFAGKGPERVLLTSFEYDVIRPLMWGKFEDLLLATAKSPAMLFYLDNVRSIAKEENRPVRTPATMRGRRGSVLRARSTSTRLERLGMSGINENYARELMELHTLGVDGGYSQEDVAGLARVLTGWSFRRPDEGGGFVFRTELHDAGKKTVLGISYMGGGIDEGERAIRMLARHPSTAHNIALKLCQRFIADDPPKSVVDRVAAVFLVTGGDLRRTFEAVVQSPEFFDPLYYRAKTKTPFEYVVSAVRAIAGETDGRFIARSLQQMGMPPYFCQPPTGYSDRAEDWVSSAALIERMNFALALAAGRTPGVRVGISASHFAESSDPIDAIGTTIGVELSESTRSTIEHRIAEESVDGRRRAQLIAGLILGGPEFQKQ